MIYSLSNYVNTYQIKNCLVYLGNNGINEKKQKGDASSKSIESFMSCRGILTFIRLIQIMER